MAKNKTVVVQLKGADLWLISAMAAIIMAFGGSLYDGIREDINRNAEYLREAESELQSMRVDFVRAHPELTRAAYAAYESAQSEVLNYDEAATVIHVLASYDFENRADVQHEEVRAALSEVGSLNPEQVEAVSENYFQIDVRDPESLTTAQLETVSDGLDLAGQLRFEAEVTGSRIAVGAGISVWAKILAVLFVVFLGIFVVRLIRGLRTED